MEFLEFARELEVPPPPPTSRRGFSIRRPVRDKGFKTAVLACLILLATGHLLAGLWFQSRLKMLEGRLPLPPATAPIETVLEVTIPEVVELDRRMDRWIDEYHPMREVQQSASARQKSAKDEAASTTTGEDAKPRRMNEAVVIERITD